MSVRVTSNFPQKSREFRTYANKLGSKIMKDGIFMALEIVGNLAVGDHMDRTSVKEMDTAPTGTKLKRRQGRLAKSILGVMNFNFSKYPKTTTQFVKNSSIGSKKESIRQAIVSGNKIEGIIGSTVKYAAIHEYGGTINAKKDYLHFKIGDNWIKTRSVTIPKRPYLHPAAEDAMPDIHRMFDSLIHETFASENI